MSIRRTRRAEKVMASKRIRRLRQGARIVATESEVSVSSTGASMEMSSACTYRRFTTTYIASSKKGRDSIVGPLGRCLTTFESLC